MSASTAVRVRSLVFVRELLQMFVPEEQNTEIQDHLSRFNGQFYSGVGLYLRSKILEVSSICSEIFAADSGSFLWEAVRSVRSLTEMSKKCLLVIPRPWIIELMIPWCQFVNLGSINVDLVNAEFFRFLMDSAFEDPIHNEDIVNCWGEVCRSTEFGVVNAAVLMDVVVEVSARFPSLESTTLVLASNLASIQPDLISTVLAFHLSSSAFPWNRSKQPHTFQHTSHLAIKNYILSLHAAFKTTPAESSNDYHLNCLSAAPITSQILAQQFESFKPHIAVLLNYLFVHLIDSIHHPAVAPLLQGLIHGFISYLHSSDTVHTSAYDDVQAHIRKILGWLEMAEGRIIWAAKEDIPASNFQLTEIPINEFSDRLLTIFELTNPNIRRELAEENINWALEGFLGHSETIHALQCFYFYLRNASGPEVPSKLQVLLFPRLLDQLSILSQLESDLNTVASLKGTNWKELPKGKQKLRDEAVETILCILKVHSAFLKHFVANRTLETQGTLFWSTMGYLSSD